MTFTMPIKTVSRANSRMHWAAKMRLTQAERETAMLLARSAMRRRPKPKRISSITLTRFSVQEMDSDNLPAALKAVRDGIADALGIDDGTKNGIEWKYKQVRCDKREQFAVRVDIEETEPT